MELRKILKLNNLIQQWEYLSEADKLDTIRKLQTVGELKPIEIKEDDEDSLFCPLHQFRLSQPCNLSKCPYAVDSEKDFNCLYHSLSRSKKGRITINETSNYLKMPITEINKVSSEAFLKIRREYLRDLINTDQPIDYRYITGHCVNCEEYIQEDLDLNTEPSLTIEYSKFGWCSLECKEAMPKWKFLLEYEYSTNFLEILKHAYLLVIEYSVRNPDKEVDSLLDLPNGTASSYKKQLRKIMTK